MDLRDSLAVGAPITTAREHGDLAEQLYLAGKWQEALGHHQQAAAQYKECLNYTHNPGLHTTLQMLHNDHARLARDLKRRISDNEQHPTSPTALKGRALPAVPSVTGIQETQPQLPSNPDRQTRPRDVYRRSVQNNLCQEGRVTAPRFQRSTLSHDDNSHTQSPGLSPSNSHLMHDSHTTEKMVDGSYMFLGDGQEPQDSFTIFFKAIEGMLDKFSQPIAFATAPLVSGSSRTCNSPQKVKSNVQSESTPIDTDGYESEDSDSSFYMIDPALSIPDSASGSQFQYPPPLFQSSSSKTGTLRAKEAGSHLLQTENKLEDVLRAREQQQKAMRDSIMMVKREAQRAMAASANLGRSVLPQPPQALQASLMGQANPSYMPIPLPRPHQVSPEKPVAPITPAVPILDPALDMQTLRRMQDLETQIQTLKNENEQQKAQISRYRQRWAKLKENAKRKHQKDDPHPDRAGPAAPTPDDGDEG
ncbi:uncharacterized protein EI90DRAFT_3121363 [Cantharellus anzutake]|uniref:uncharacterized protein n=1 Tax=Cantharellus anzutake TaxID=1750568 RepID=UPI001904648B|nr:uncharacterized protein EI90DRAFT_3121363 [Cantharellus anzutake]KAF8333990.1 hypothetical protein EI90DRAFT_3121363 [Cantharellus anzutake]